jgi:hypothetical protein
MWDAECWMFDPLPQREWAWFLPGAAYPFPRQMALESKPLFHPEVLRQQVRSFNLPERVVAAGDSRGNPADPTAAENTERVEG